MIDNKILENAAMGDEELDQVAGGTYSELRQEAKYLEQAFGYTRRFVYRTGIGNIEYVDREVLDRGFKIFGVQVTYDGDKPNEYFIGGNKVTREEVWNHINKETN